MDFKQRKKINENEKNYHFENLKISREFSKSILLELNELVRSIVLFGSNTHDTLNKNSDIDIMVVLDNVSVFVTEELREAYNIIVKKISQKHPDKLHILTVNLSDLWDMARKGDPVLINILRYGMPIFDRDLIEPMQYLLEIGKIRPTREAAYNYISRSETLIEETQNHLKNALLDIYYSVVDMVHATLITQKITPPSPKQMPIIFKETFKKTDLEKYYKDIEYFYNLSKDIEYNRDITIDGKLYDSSLKKAKLLISALKKFSEKKIKNTDIFEL